MRLCVAFLTLFLVSSSLGANIFALLPTFSHSHYLLMVPLLQELSKNGNNLTVVTLKGIDYASETYHEIIPTVPKLYKDIFYGKSIFGNGQFQSDR